MNFLIRFLQILIVVGFSKLSSQNKVYTVNKIQNEILVTGFGTDKLWEKATNLSDFIYPWRDENPPGTEFKALWSDTYFYFLFIVEDHEIISSGENIGEKDLLKSDRVEIFFRSNVINKPYYSLEMDAKGRCLDTEGVFFDKVDFEWNWPREHFALKASQNENGYTVEGSISLESLRQLDMYSDDGILNAGLYRGEFFLQPDKKIGVKWISWVKPNSKNFHIPSSFGVLKLIN